MLRLCLVAALSLQFSAILRFSQPYPAVIMPGFEDDGSRAVTFDAVFVTPDGETPVPPRVLFQPFPVSHHGKFGEHFRPSDKPAPESVRHWLKDRAAVLTPGASRVEFRWRKLDGTPAGTRTVALEGQP